MKIQMNPIPKQIGQLQNENSSLKGENTTIKIALTIAVIAGVLIALHIHRKAKEEMEKKMKLQNPIIKPNYEDNDKLIF